MTAAVASAIPPQHMNGNNSVAVLWGSQTGTARAVAGEVCRRLVRRGISCRTWGLDAYPVALLPRERRGVLFVVATTGQGEAPDNMRAFWRFIMWKRLQPGSLAGVPFAVLGLGDSAYAQFNWVAKKLHRRMEQLGAHLLCPRALADDQHRLGYRFALRTWCASLWPSLGCDPALDDGEAAAAAAVGADGQPLTGWDAAAAQGEARIRHAHTPCPVVVVLSREQGTDAAVAASCSATTTTTPASSLPSKDHIPSQMHPFQAALHHIERLTQPDWEQCVYEVALDVGSDAPVRSALQPEASQRWSREPTWRDKLRWEAGDVCCVVPRNSDASVDAFLAEVGASPHMMVLEARVNPDAVEARVGGQGLYPAAEGTHGDRGGHLLAPGLRLPARLDHVLRDYMDIDSGCPGHHFYVRFAGYATAPHEREKLAEYVSDMGASELHEYNDRERRTVVEVLQDFPGTRPPLTHLLPMLAPIQPRLFSIASSAACHPTQIRLTVAALSYRTPFGRDRVGLCSQYWQRLAALPATTTAERGAGNLAGTEQDTTGARVSSLSLSLSSSSPSSTALPPIPSASGASLPIRIWVRPGSISFSRAPLSTPWLMIGPGTGCAVFKAALEERRARLRATSMVEPPPVVGSVWWLFGCRHRAQDYLHGALWESMAADGTVAHYDCAFSRDSPDEGRVYVQRILRQQGVRVWQLLQQGAVIAVSGNAQRMPKDVREALRDVVQEHGGSDLATREAAEAWIRNAEVSGRYMTDVWL